MNGARPRPTRVATGRRRKQVRYAVSTYAYDARGLRTTAFRSENGVVSHDGTYAYDAAGRLTGISDAIASSGLGGTYAWHPDGTLASMPGLMHRWALEYDEEGRLIELRALHGTVSTLRFSYANDFDGGRRWRKDHLGNIWTWYACGVGCGAGELTEEQSELTGLSWTVVRQNLPMPTATRLGNELQVFDLSSLSTIALFPSGSVSGSIVSDRFGVVRGISGSTQAERPGDAGLLHRNGTVWAVGVGVKINPKPVLAALVALACGGACVWGGTAAYWAWSDCNRSCSLYRGWYPRTNCLANCMAKRLKHDKPVDSAMILACIACICLIPKITPTCISTYQTLPRLRDRLMGREHRSGHRTEYR